MSDLSCPVDQLPLLLQDDMSTLPQSATQQLQAHLETCEACQHELEQLAADQGWWQRATHCLSHFEDLPSYRSVIGDSLLVRIDDAKSEMLADPVSTLLSPSGHPETLGRIDQFEVEEKIGQGGMGVVYRGFDSALNRPVAIKVLSPHLASSGVARKRFAREAQAAAAVVHPNVVPIYSVNDSPERPYLVMALVDGRSLQEHVSEHGPMDLMDIVRVSHQVAAGLAAAHEQGLIHRDTKPANVLLQKDVSRVMITDFGLARAADDVALTRTGWLAGTPDYMSPEQVLGKEVDQRSDLFSLGSTIYYMATGREPFRAETPLAVLERIKNAVPVQIRSLNSQIPVTLDRIVQRLLAKDPTDRIGSAKELEQILARYLAHLQHPQSNPEPRLGLLPSTVRHVKRRAFGLTFVGLVMAACWLFWPASIGPLNVNTPSTTPVPASERDSTQWMHGLQSVKQWASDAAQLEQEMLRLETEFHSDGTLIPVDLVLPHDQLSQDVEKLRLQIERLRNQPPGNLETLHQP